MTTRRKAPPTALVDNRPRAGRDSRVVTFGDFQTPDALADAVCRVVRETVPHVGSVIEPTCGQGSFLAAAAPRFPDVPLLGFDVSQDYVKEARGRVPRARIEVADFFRTDWDDVLRRLPEPVLILGNPPWVTSSTLGAMGERNMPAKANFKNHSGLDALTGKSNFDISEWILLRLIEAAKARRFALAMLCKVSVARRVMERVSSIDGSLHGSVRTIDARNHFAAAVEAVLFTVRNDVAPRSSPGLRWAVYPAVGAFEPTGHWDVVAGKICGDWEGHLATHALEGTSEIEWRSGVKHDCAPVMELHASSRGFTNGLGQCVELEDAFVFPLLKGSDLAAGRTASARRVLVTQRKLGDDTSRIRDIAPATWRYLSANRSRFDARKSSVYREKPPFAMFGVGSYSFAPYKVAISGICKKLAFRVVEPIDGRPVMVDDTSYFLPCESREQASEIGRALESARAKRFFEARIFWDAMRPINKALLQSLSLRALLGAESSALRSRRDG